MRRSGGLFGALFLVAAVIVSAPVQAEDIPFFRTVIASDSPHGPCGNALGDIDGDGRPDAIVAGSEGPLVWYAYPGWTQSVIAVQGYITQGGLAVGDLDRDGDLDVTVGTVWFENPRRLPAGNPAAGDLVTGGGKDLLAVRSRHPIMRLDKEDQNGSVSSRGCCDSVSITD